MTDDNPLVNRKSGEDKNSDSDGVISPRQCRAARALLNWSQAVLARQSGISRPTIVALERGAGQLKPETVAIIQRTFVDAGVEFIDGNTVRLARTDGS